ncbi:MAG TPA: molybdopterin-dependent oxidoreductase [Vicinamibacterales bacterium]|nr:molybdopterin-dependent oxidoreductase [Vicinamibacterales bacterium]
MGPSVPHSLSRRTFLAAALLLPAALRQAGRGDARFVSSVPLGTPGAASPPFGRLLGDGLDARLFTDLSQLVEPSAIDPEPSAISHQPSRSPVTATERFFIRTAAPSNLPAADPWTIHVDGLVRSPGGFKLRDLESQGVSSSRVLLECSGNADPLNYGLLSAADWEGVPIAALLDRAQPSTPSYRVLVAGIDDTSRQWRTSIAGASWVFSRDDLSRALLAVRMNGAPLPRDHGAPARLIVPGWYGCTCIKWVDRVELVADDAPATSQMREFAGRTHQPAGAALARDFIPATIDTAAMPVRVDKWIVNGRPEYRITGIVWGGSKATNALSIRFRSGGAWTRVENCPLPESTLTWSLWTHTWHPTDPGRYQIVLRVDDPSIRTRRLDVFFYVREVQIDDV